MYKRQVQNILSGAYLDEHENTIKINILQAARMCNSAWDQVRKKQLLIAFVKVVSATLKAVSYTHLDVYKRQILFCAPL